MSPEPTSTPSPVAPGVAFAVERFEWTSRDRIELVGRWSGLRGHRFLRPTLDVQVDGERRRMLADLEHKPWAPENGQDWVAAFKWRGEPANFDEAELTVSPDLAVQLPAPGGSVERGETQAATPAEDRLPARRPRSAVLEAELAAALAEVERMSGELEKTRAMHSEAAKELRERLRDEHAKIRTLEGELEQARAAIALAEDAAAEEADRLRDERHAAAAERDAALAARDAAAHEADEARSARDEALQKLSTAEGERDALAEARDRARLERNAWMSRARAAATGRPSAEARAVPKPLAGREPAPTDEAPGSCRSRGDTRAAGRARHGPAPAVRAAHDPDRRATWADCANTPGLAHGGQRVDVVAAGLGPAAGRRAGPGRRRPDSVPAVELRLVTQLDYVPAPGFFDEFSEGPGVPRAPASALTAVLGGPGTRPAPVCGRAARRHLRSAGDHVRRLRARWRPQP